MRAIRTMQDMQDKERPADESAGAQRAAAAPPRGDSSLGSLTELINAVTRCIELRGAVEIAEVELAHITERTDAGQESTQARDVARIRLRVQKQQFAAVEQLLRRELEMAEADLQQAKAQHAAGFVSDAEVRRAEARVAALRAAF